MSFTAIMAQCSPFNKIILSTNLLIMSILRVRQTVVVICDHTFLEWIWAICHTDGILCHMQGRPLFSIWTFPINLCNSSWHLFNVGLDNYKINQWKIIKDVWTTEAALSFISFYALNIQDLCPYWTLRFSIQPGSNHKLFNHDPVVVESQCLKCHLFSKSPTTALRYCNKVKSILTWRGRVLLLSMNMSFTLKPLRCHWRFFKYLSPRQKQTPQTPIHSFKLIPYLYRAIEISSNQICCTFALLIWNTHTAGNMKHGVSMTSPLGTNPV